MPNKQIMEYCQEIVEEGIKKFYTYDNYSDFLVTLSIFHNYSYSNNLLIKMQKPDATLVAGLNAWKNNFNRTVNNEEKGIIILTPTISKKNVITNGTEENKEIIKNVIKDFKPKTKEVEYFSYKPVYVFDISQTSGEALSDTPIRLKLKNNEAKVLISAIREVSDCAIYFSNPNEDDNFEENKDSYYSSITNSIILNEQLSYTDMLKSFFNEYAYTKVNHLIKDDNRAKLEAESMAFILYSFFNLDVEVFDFSYIDEWKRKDTNILKEVLNNIQSNVSDFIDKVEPIFERNIELLNDDDIIF